MKRTWRIIPFAALAAALVAASALAASCSDGSSEDWSGILQGDGAPTSESADASAETGAESVVITADDVLELIQEIGQIAGNNGGVACWDFPSAELGEDSSDLVAVVPWVLISSNDNRPFISATMSYLRQRGKVSTELLSVDLSAVDWDEDTEGRQQATTKSAGERYATVEIEPAEGASAELPSTFQYVIITFDSRGWKWLQET